MWFETVGCSAEKEHLLRCQSSICETHQEDTGKKLSPLWASTEFRSRKRAASSSRLGRTTLVPSTCDSSDERTDISRQLYSTVSLSARVSLSPELPSRWPVQWFPWAVLQTQIDGPGELTPLPADRDKESHTTGWTGTLIHLWWAKITQYPLPPASEDSCWAPFRSCSGTKEWSLLVV